MRRISLFIIFCIGVVSFSLYILLSKTSQKNYHLQQAEQPTTKPSVQQSLNPLSIQAMRERLYPGSSITIVKVLPDGPNYHQYLTSYQSDGLTIYALLTVPMGLKPPDGWPVILFNHGFIPPEIYEIFPHNGQYASYYPVFSSSGYIVFKPDYRGNGNSQGRPEGAYYSPAYAIDDLNALHSIQQYRDANPNKIGVWAHSMGGNITLRDLVVDTKDIKVAVIWGGVVGSYTDLMNNWQNRVRYIPSSRELALRNASRAQLLKQYGTPQQNPTFWNSIDPTYFIRDITAPIQLDVGSDDEEVPVAFSGNLYKKLVAAGKTVEFYSYPGANHNISQGFSLAMHRSLDFFDKYLKSN